MFLSPRDTQLSRGEPIEDVARVIETVRDTDLFASGFSIYIGENWGIPGTDKFYLTTKKQHTITTITANQVVIVENLAAALLLLAEQLRQQLGLAVPAELWVARPVARAVAAGAAAAGAEMARKRAAFSDWRTASSAACLALRAENLGDQLS